MRSCRASSLRLWIASCLTQFGGMSLAQWSHRTGIRNKSEHLLSGLLFDDAGHRMVATHATKDGVRYRYYVSTPFLHGEAKTASAGSVSRIPAADIEDVIVKSLKEHLAADQGEPITSAAIEGRGGLAQLIAGIIVHKDNLVVQLKSDTTPDSADDRSLSIPWQKPPSKISRQILLPHNASRSDVRPEQFERRARLVSAIARGRRWLDDVVSESVREHQAGLQSFRSMRRMDARRRNVSAL
jgi:site-specific DNA recombinase